MNYIDDINYLIKLLSARKDGEYFLYFNFLCADPFYIENPYEKTCDRKYIKEDTFDYLLDNFDFVRVGDAPVTGRIYRYMGEKKDKEWWK